MHVALEIFRVNVARTRHLGGIHGAFSTLTTSAIDSSDLLRAQIVLTVSALDYFVHEITMRGMLEIFDGTRPATDSFNKQKVSGKLLLATAASSRAAFEMDIRERHAFQSFQQPEKIADAIRLVSDKSLWKELALKLSKSEKEVKTQLRLIVDRRNKIAHEADISPSFPGERWPITPQDATVALDFIEALSEAIYDIVV